MSQVTTQTNNHSWPIRKHSSNFPFSSGGHYNLHIFECYTSSIIYCTGHFSLSEGRCSKNTFEAFHGGLEGSVESDKPNTRPQNPTRVTKVNLNEKITQIFWVRFGKSMLVVLRLQGLVPFFPFFFSNFWCSGSDNHQYDHLAKSGYKKIITNHPSLFYGYIPNGT